METLKWNAHFKTGLRTVDDQHHGLVDLINDLGRSVACSSEPTTKQIDDNFHELKLYTQYHFDEEGQLMLDARVDKRHVQTHLESHRYFIKALHSVSLGHNDRSETAERLVEFVTSWLTDHILGTDQAMARQVHAIQLGKSPHVAYRQEVLNRQEATEPSLDALEGLFHQGTPG